MLADLWPLVLALATLLFGRQWFKRQGVVQERARRDRAEADAYQETMENIDANVVFDDDADAARDRLRARSQ